MVWGLRAYGLGFEELGGGRTFALNPDIFLPKEHAGRGFDLARASIGLGFRV